MFMKNPKEGSTYLLTADVSRGTKNDYSAFIVFDVTTRWKSIASLQSSEITRLNHSSFQVKSTMSQEHTIRHLFW